MMNPNARINSSTPAGSNARTPERAAPRNGHMPTWSDRLGTFGNRIARAGADEASFDLRRVVANGAARLFPQLSFNRTRTALLRAAGLRLGRGALVMGPLDITGPGNFRELLSIGDETLITGPLHIDLGARVQIGNCVRIGHHVVFLTIDHEIGPATYRCGRLVSAPITIGDGVWIGSCVTVLAGVSIASGCVIAAGATVVRDVPPNTLAAGVPARFVRNLEADSPPPSLRRSRTTPLED
jgi:carbonic anhydrase/acetyltransferase-like protein (isoleucine patch superfamily)